MRHIKDVLKKVYQEKAKVYDELEIFQQALRGAREALPSHLQSVVPLLRVQTYRNGVLTVSLPQKYLNPDIYFALQELKETLCTKTKKRIQTIRLVQKTSF